MSESGLWFDGASGSSGSMYGYLDQPVNSYISGSVDYAPADWGSVGPTTAGTYNVPVTAQPVNSPQNTAGYSSSISPDVAKLLSQGIGVLGQLGMGKMQLDYAKAEATNGGLFWNGRYAQIGRNGLGIANGQINLSVLLLLGGAAWLLLRKG
jgi:hypothetical protein